MQHRVVAMPPRPQLVRISIDFALGLEFEAEAYRLSVRIGGAFSLTRDGQRWSIPAEEPSSLGIVLGLHHAQLVAISYTEEGAARLDFDRRGVIEIPPDPQYEAWQFSDTLGNLVVSLPGGGVAVWSGFPDEPDRPPS